MQQHPTVGLWDVLGPFSKGADGKWYVRCACVCGLQKPVRYKDVRAGGTNGCRSCVHSIRMLASMHTERHRYPQTMPGAGAGRKRPDALSAQETQLRDVLSGARDRCRNPSNAAHANYGGRGICFLFSSVEQAAAWVQANIGYRPTGAHTLDRIDNNRHYEPGNLRWATRTEQARNKRAYNGAVYGRRLRDLLVQKTDYTYEGLRKYVRLGYTDAQILALKKPTGGRPRKARK